MGLVQSATTRTMSQTKQLTSMLDKGEKEGRGRCAGQQKKLGRPHRGQTQPNETRQRAAKLNQSSYKIYHFNPVLATAYRPFVAASLSEALIWRSRLHAGLRYDDCASPDQTCKVQSRPGDARQGYKKCHDQCVGVSKACAISGPYSSYPQRVRRQFSIAGVESGSMHNEAQGASLPRCVSRSVRPVESDGHPRSVAPFTCSTDIFKAYAPILDHEEL